MSTQNLLVLLCLANFATAIDWNDFANNFATDIAPIVTLFGEQVTKQFLSESTHILDNIIFGVAPLGIITAVVSVIRIYGNSSLKSFIGRSQEPHGVAEAELCSSTSDDVCELWSNGGICRVFGRPKILEFFYTPRGNDFYRLFKKNEGIDKSYRPPHCGIELPVELLGPLGSGGGNDHRLGLWKKLNPKKKSYQVTPNSNSERLIKSKDLKFARYPNLSLNIGMKLVSVPTLSFFAVVGVLLQLSFFGYATWATYYHPQFYEGEDESPPEDWSFWVMVVGTVLLVIGMILCSMLIERKSSERTFSQHSKKKVSSSNEASPPHKVSSSDKSSSTDDKSSSTTSPDDNKSVKSTIFWLQPGGQRVGDQLFNAFGFSEHKDSYITSWKEGDSKIPQKGLKHFITSTIFFWIAITASMLGFVLQFIGLRGLHGTIALYQLASTLLMAIIRAALRSRRFNGKRNMLSNPHIDIEDHELDWQALNIEPSDQASKQNTDKQREQDQAASDRSDESMKRAWFIDDSFLTEDNKPPVHLPHEDGINVTTLEVKNGPSLRLVGFLPSLNRDDGVAERLCANSGLEWIRQYETDAQNSKEALPNTAARTMYYRSRLAYLTKSPVATGGQAWSSDIREMASNLKLAMQQTATYIFSNMDLQEHWKDVQALVWSTSCQVIDPSQSPCQYPIHFFMVRNGKYWNISEHQLEAILGLWLWSLRIRYSHLPGAWDSAFKNKVLFVKKEDQSKYETAIRLWTSRTNTIISSPINLPESRPALSVANHNLKEILNSMRNSSNPLDGSTLEISARSSPIEMVAQDIFTLFISRIAGIIKPIEEISLRSEQNASLNFGAGVQTRLAPGISNSDIDSIVEIAFSSGRGIGPRQDVVTSIILPLLQGERLPDFDRKFHDLIAQAISFRRSGKFETAEELLMGLLSLSPAGSKEKVIRALGEVYRAAAQSDQDRVQNFAQQGMLNIKRVCFDQQLPNEAKATLEHYQAIGDYIFKEETKSKAIVDYNFKKEIKSKIFREHRSGNDSKAKKFVPLSFRELEKYMEGDGARSRGLTLIMEFQLHEGHRNLTFWLLRWALQSKNPELVEDLWNIDPEIINFPSEQAIRYNNDPIFSAIEPNFDIETFSRFLEWPKLNTDSQNFEGTTPLLMAVKNNNGQAVELLLKNSPNLKATNDHGEMSLPEACHRGNLDIVKQLINANADVNHQARVFGSPLAAAAGAGHVNVLRYLIERGADVNLPLSKGDYGSALAAAVDSSQKEAVAYLVEEAQADVNMQLSIGEYSSALEMAVTTTTEILKHLVDPDGNIVNWQIKQGEYGSALAAAASEAPLETVQFLVEKAGANINMLIEHGMHGYALVSAAEAVRYDNIDYLIKKGSKGVGGDNTTLCSALVHAAHFGLHETVQLLCSPRVLKNHPSNDALFKEALSAAEAEVSIEDWVSRRSGTPIFGSGKRKLIMSDDERRQEWSTQGMERRLLQAYKEKAARKLKHKLGIGIDSGPTHDKTT